jgi:hypothetical protein
VCSPFYSTSCSPSHSPSYSPSHSHSYPPSHSPSYPPSHFSPSVYLLYSLLKLGAVIPDFRSVGVTLFVRKSTYPYKMVLSYRRRTTETRYMKTRRSPRKASREQFIYAFILANSNDFCFLVDLVVSFQIL